MAKKPFPKIGLALGSGGAKGLAHIGVIKSLEKHAIPIDYIAASSIGSFIGAHYARYQDSKKLEEVILNFDRKKWISLFDFTVQGGIIKGGKTEAFIADILESATFEDLKIPLHVVATNFNTAASVTFSQGDLIKAIRASISVPAVYQPIIFQNKLLADGGLSNPIPVTELTAMGADITIAVNLDQLFAETALATIPALSKIPWLAIEILRHNLAQYAVQSADVIIAPQNKQHVGLVGWNMLFDNEKAKQIITEGEEATDKLIPEIKKHIAHYHKKQSPIQKFFAVFSRR